MRRIRVVGSVRRGAGTVVKPAVVPAHDRGVLDGVLQLTDVSRKGVPPEQVHDFMNPVHAGSGSTIDADTWYERLNRLAGDLYPGRYTRDEVRGLCAMASEVRALARAKRSLIIAHNYVYPELQEVADAVGDSLGLSQYVARQRPRRVDFCGVWFMGETAKIIVGKRCRVYMSDVPGCSLVDSIDGTRVSRWIAAHPRGIVISYVNSDAAIKAMSDYVCTSGNAARVLLHASRTGRGRPILFLPDKHLGGAAVAQARLAPGLVDLYDGSCHVHAAIDANIVEAAIDRHPDAECLVHPECACAEACLSGGIGSAGTFTGMHPLSSEQMLHRARCSPAREFVVATEKGMVYRLRKEVPHKEFHPVSNSAVCEYMKMNTLEKLLSSLQHDRVEVHVHSRVRKQARRPIRRMLAIHGAPDTG